jgi:hypothetical protein
MVVAQQVPQHTGGRWVRSVLTIAKLKRWSINYYIDTAQAAEHAASDLARAGGGLGDYYSERETRTPVWLLAGDTHTTAALVGLTDAQRASGDADAELVARWLDDGIAPNGAHGRAFGQRGVHGFDLTFCAPKSVSLVRALRTDEVMAKAIADALTSYRADTAAGKDALLVCDTTEMTDALNQRIHRENLDAHARTVTGTRGHRIGVSDLIITRRNDPAINLRSATGIAGQADSVRNGNRWRVAAIDPTRHRVAAERLDDGARAVFEGEYLREHISLGYAVTVHSAQGATADTTHAVLSESATRSLLYVAMTRGRDTNTAYVYERTAGDIEYGFQKPDGTPRQSRPSSSHRP